MSEILVVTCPSGKQASHLLPLIYNKGKFKLRLAAHSQASLEKLKTQYPDAEVVQADISSLETCQQLLHGASAVFHVGPPLHSQEKAMGFHMIDAATVEARKSGSMFKHFVFSSVLGTQHRNLMQHDLKSYVEERLFLSPLNWTILKPTNFMDNFPVALVAGQDKPVFGRLWSPEVPNSMIALRDLGEAAAKVLNEGEAHYLAEYPLCSTMPISDRYVAEALGRRIGKEIELVTPPIEAAVNTLLTLNFKPDTGANVSHIPDDYAASVLAVEGDLRGDIVRDEAERLILFYSRRGLKGNPNVLRWLLGRQPTTVEEMIEYKLKDAGLV